MSVSHLCNAKLIWDHLFEVYVGTSYRPAMDKRAGLDYAKYALYDEDDDPAVCLMAKSGKVSAHKSHKSHSSSGDDSDAIKRPSYSKLASLASKQGSSLERIQKLLDQSDDLLHLEVKKNQSLIDDIKSLHEKYVDMQGHYESLSMTHEKLSSDYLQQGQALEDLRVSHNNLQTENDSLLAQQISASQDSFVPP
jgi:septal ring factor EnvC (AmiA/AmiB activator)